MAIGSATMLTALKAVAEDTRLRIVALLAHGELTVSDLVDVLGQSQPRTSRHLRLLTDAGVVTRHREGTRVFFDLVPGGPLRESVDALLARIDPADPTIAADLERREVVRRRRDDAARDYFARIAPRWDEERSFHAPDEIVETAILAIAGEQRYRTVLDLGTGTGRMLQLLAADPASVDRAVGLDTSHSMLAVARANFERAGLRHLELRQGDVHSPPIERDRFDLVILHQVLHFLDDPAHALAEAARLLSPAGRLVVVDVAPHSLEFLRTDHAHRRLGFRPDTVESWLRASGLATGPTRVIGPEGAADGEQRLTVVVWVGRDPRPTAPPSHPDTPDPVPALGEPAGPTGATPT